MSTQALDSDASRLPSGGILKPSSKDRLKLTMHDNATGSSPNQKRKRDGEAMEDLLKPSIVVKAHSLNLSVKPLSLQPLMLLPREHFQLSFLDLASPYGSFESSRYYESSIKLLDLEGRMGSRPIVLIARRESDKTLYVLERQNNGLYTLCHLGSWVDLVELEGLATASCPHLIQKQPNTSVESNAPLPLTTPQLHHDNKKRRLAIESLQLLVKKPRSRSMSTPSQLVSPTGMSIPNLDNVKSQPTTTGAHQEVSASKMLEGDTESQMAKAAELDELLAAPTAEGIFDNIRNQYLEFLYHSMGSLAYFAKGPLSRARAAFHLDCDSNLEMKDLLDFLKSIVMKTTQFDKKYRGTVPDIIAKMKTTFEDSDAEPGATKTKKRKSKKMKLGRDGLYPSEEDHVKKWWNAHKPEFKDDETMTTAGSQDTRLQISLLRLRETQLQMIIILEILALEPLITSQNGEDSQLPGLPGLNKAATEAPKDTQTKKRNRHNLQSLLDVHTNWLTIWQTTTLDDIRFANDTQIGKELETQKSSKATSDPLKDFCFDIVVPFFSARLPEKCDSINRQLGGPVMMPPAKPKAKKQDKPETATKPRSQIGKGAVRPLPPKRRASILEDLSKETERNRRSVSRGPSGAIALMRSATTPMLKRETSEGPSMRNIPKAGSATAKEKTARSSLPAPVKRRSEEERAKNNALVQKQLQDAITTLRRPNRDAVSKAMAEADERRAITSLSSLKKSRKPTQHSRPQDVIKATPVGKRFTDVLGMGAGVPANHSRGSDFMNSLTRGSMPSSSLIPSSAPRKRNHAAFALDESPDIPRSTASADRIQATPARSSKMKQSFLSAPEPDEAILASSPIMFRKPSLKSFRDSGINMVNSDDELTETPAKPRATPISQEGLVAATPTKRRILNNRVATPVANVNNTPAKKGEKSPKQKVSIYEKLGWDDDLDELV